MADTKNGLIAGLMGVLVVVIIVATVAIPVVDDYVDNRTVQRDQDSNVPIGTYSELTLKDNITLDPANRTVDGVAVPDRVQFGVWTDAGYVALIYGQLVVGVYSNNEITETLITKSLPTVTIQSGVVTVNSESTQVFTFTKGYVSDPDGKLKSIYQPNGGGTITIDKDTVFTFVSPRSESSTGQKIWTNPFAFKATVEWVEDTQTFNLNVIDGSEVGVTQVSTSDPIESISEDESAFVISSNEFGTNSSIFSGRGLYLMDHVTYTAKDTSATPMSIIPIILIISVVMGVIGLFYSKRFY